jgi:hypothetical protein
MLGSEQTWLEVGIEGFQGRQIQVTINIEAEKYSISLSSSPLVLS